MQNFGIFGRGDGWSDFSCDTCNPEFYESD